MPCNTDTKTVHNNIFYDRFIASLFNRKMQNIGSMRAHALHVRHQTLTMSQRHAVFFLFFFFGHTTEIHENRRIYEADAATDYCLAMIICSVNCAQCTNGGSGLAVCA